MKIKTSLITIAILIIAVNSIAQENVNSSIIFINDSSQYEGRIIENISGNDYLIIKLKNGELKLIKKNDIVEIKKINTGTIEKNDIVEIKQVNTGTIETTHYKKNDFLEKKSFFSFALNMGRSFPLTNAMEGFDDTKLNPSFMVGGSSMFFIRQCVAFEALITYNKFRITEFDDEIGHLTYIPLILNYKVQFAPERRKEFGGHFDFGAGFAFTNFKNGSSIRELEESTGVTIKVETNKPLLFNMGLGLEYFSNKIAIGFDIRLTAGNVNTDWKFNGQSQHLSSQIYATSFILGLNFRYCFRK